MPTRPLIRAQDFKVYHDYTSNGFSVDQPAETQIGDLLVAAIELHFHSVSSGFTSLTIPGDWTVLYGPTMQGDSKTMYAVVMKQATVAGFLSHTGFNNNGDEDADADPTRVIQVFIVSGARAIGVDGGPISAMSIVTEYSAVGLGPDQKNERFHTLTSPNTVTPQQLDTLLLHFASWVGGHGAGMEDTGWTVNSPSGMTLYYANDPGSSGTDWSGGWFYRNLSTKAQVGPESVYIHLGTGSSFQLVNHALWDFIVLRAPNTAPTAPGAFTFPVAGAGYKIGQTLSVDWGDATDADGDAITYTLQYSRDNGTWTNMASGLASSAYSWNTTTWLPGSYQLRVVANDPWTAGAYTYLGAFNLVAGGPRLIVG